MTFLGIQDGISAFLEMTSLEIYLINVKLTEFLLINTKTELVFVFKKSPNIMRLKISPQKTCSAKGIPSEEMTNFGFRKLIWF